MTIERVGNEIIIRLSDSIDPERLQRIIDFVSHQEATANSRAKQKDVDELSSEVNKAWWKKNKDRFLKDA